MDGWINRTAGMEHPYCFLEYAMGSLRYSILRDSILQGAYIRNYNRLTYWHIYQNCFKDSLDAQTGSTNFCHPPPCVCVLQWKCCGVVGYTDWHEALKEKVVPDRCCQEHYQECGRNSTNMFWTRVSGHTGHQADTGQSLSWDVDPLE